jgi:hypothetical protein
MKTQKYRRNNMKYIKAYAIQLKAAETVKKTKEFKELMDTTGSIGVHPDVPFAYALFNTDKDRIKAFRKFSKIFDYCKVVAEVAYIPETDLKGRA